ncbi:uncharacterized protein K460DRAFT_368403 [Cucurbitaria berberidis CBS 394.84]|uniref:Uncharacterized protein n=1 Tax=Cucurbitaria berberidis CBS 394.84 TaxID=1168544 RepID=A0A9P4GDQ4_9PLEO|nr:uncharacterized protein K460DRAFT_368403 [Cucurbitaria berberidis CBS 394.84]KAF1843507.1 hypothetical protein K460DRAFT_368403 [Cucurbitaria berberidis CBS 394.84]
MASTSRYSTEMPGFYSPSPSHARASSRTSYFDPAPRFSFATETSGRQVMESDSHETRNRSPYGEHDATTTQSFTTSSWGDNSLGFSRSTDAKSPPPLAHDRYELAKGGMDGSYQFGRQNGDYDDYFQLQKQRGMWSVPPTPHAGVAKQLAMDGMQTTPNGSKSWSIMGLVGGVAGKLFQFCTVPFRGFQAGGGQSYNLDAQGEIAAKLGLQDDSYLHQSGPVQQKTPGDFPSDVYGVLSAELLNNERPRMTKRLRTADNWVVVGTDGETESRPSTPRLSERRLPVQSRSPSQIPRPVSRAGATTPSLKRPSLIPVSRRSTMDRRSFHGSAKVSPSSHNAQRSYSRLSYGSPAMFEETPNKPQKSPLPKESQRLLNKVRREELEEDARVRRMSSQMSAMLREAREALGSKFEVEEFDDDDHGANDVGFAQQSSWYSR